VRPTSAVRTPLAIIEAAMIMTAPIDFRQRIFIPRVDLLSNEQAQFESASLFLMRAYRDPTRMETRRYPAGPRRSIPDTGFIIFSSPLASQARAPTR
jgi:hypothetical protein